MDTVIPPDQEERLKALIQEGELTYAQIGGIFGVSRQRIHQKATKWFGRRPRWEKEGRVIHSNPSTEGTS